MTILSKDFYGFLAQTSKTPVGLEIASAKGIWLTDVTGKKYLDLISGIAVSNLGHGNPQVIKAIKNQADKHTHIMVYGEYVQSSQVQFAKLICSLLPKSLNSVYFVNSGSEAVEGALKLAKRYTGRKEIISFRNAYHGSTHGALSVMGDDTLKKPYGPLLPGIKILPYNDIIALKNITERTACVIIEPIQGEGGTIVPDKLFLKALQKCCKETGTLLILDEIQTGFGRTGKLFAFEHFEITPDIMTIGKAMGGGLPLGGFVANRKIMQVLADNPPLGHITTFGGHPLCCAAGLAALDVLIKDKFHEQAAEKEKLFRTLLKHPAIKEIRGKGLMLAIEFHNEELCKKVIENCLSQGNPSGKKGIIVDWFLFCPTAMRIAPPLIIQEKEIKYACSVIISAINEVTSK
ncbi:MAG TPA: aspartate aminotransferase family protein [Bacteroidia bacterium]|jgi:acetylornithine/N-succinyldiaminopimelate aminotransferase|nr:aspartate aminotransferase family protein [Bacteroidia bacterium]